jgi:hypothetical protein
MSQSGEIKGLEIFGTLCVPWNRYAFFDECPGGGASGKPNSPTLAVAEPSTKSRGSRSRQLDQLFEGRLARLVGRDIARHGVADEGSRQRPILRP